MNQFGELVPALPVRILTQQGELVPALPVRTLSHQGEAAPVLLVRLPIVERLAAVVGTRTPSIAHRSHQFAQNQAGSPEADRPTRRGSPTPEDKWLQSWRGGGQLETPPQPPIHRRHNMGRT